MIKITSDSGDLSFLVRGLWMRHVRVKPTILVEATTTLLQGLQAMVHDESDDRFNKTKIK